MNSKNPLLYASLLILPFGMFLMHVNPVLYFIGIVISFLATLIPSLKQLLKPNPHNMNVNQKKQKRLMLVIGLYLLGGFAALIFL